MGGLVMKQINETTWKSDNGLITFTHGDCMDLMSNTPDKYFDLAIVDKINMFLLLLCQSILVSLYQIKTI